jgi:hypothetical protein
MSVDDDLKRIADLRSQARSLNDLIEKARQLRAQIETHLQTLRGSTRPVRKPASERRAGKPDRRRATRRDRRTPR